MLTKAGAVFVLLVGLVMAKRSVTPPASLTGGQDREPMRGDARLPGRLLIRGGFVLSGLLFVVGVIVLNAPRPNDPPGKDLVQMILQRERGIGIGILAASLALGGLIEVTRRNRDAPWRQRILDQIEYIQFELSRVPPTNRHNVDYNNARAAVDKAQSVIQEYWYSQGAAWPRAWSALHQASESLIMVADDGLIRSAALELEGSLAGDPIERSDPRKTEYPKILNHVRRDSVIASRLTDRDRTAIRMVLHWVNDRSERYYEDLRSFHNLTLGLAVGLGLVLTLVTLITSVDSTILPICATNVEPKCPGGVYDVGYDTPHALDVLYIEILGAFGGLLLALRSIPRFTRLLVPIGIYTTQAWLKALLGAAFAVVGVVAIQRGVLAGYPPQAGDRLFIYALLFGLAQEPLTRVIDNRLMSLLDGTRSTREPRSGSSEHGVQGTQTATAQ